MMLENTLERLLAILWLSQGLFHRPMGVVIACALFIGMIFQEGIMEDAAQRRTATCSPSRH